MAAKVRTAGFSTRALLLLALSALGQRSLGSAALWSRSAARVATVPSGSVSVQPRWPLQRLTQGRSSGGSSSHGSQSVVRPHSRLDSVTASSLELHPVMMLAEGLSLGMRKFVDILAEKKDHLLAGAVARGVMVSSLYPVDTIKTRVQMYGKSEAMSVDPKVLYAGLSPSMLGQIPYGCLCFGLYEVYKDIFLNKFPAMSRDAINLASAVLSDVTGSVWLCPSEVLKQQMQAGGGSSVVAAAVRTWKASGPAGFFQGYGGQLLRDIPFRALQLPLYERTKELIDRHFGHHRHTLGDGYETWKEGMSGVVSGSIASAVTTPFDVVKTRLMVDSSYRGALDCAVKVARKEGLLGLFRGVVPRVLYTGPSTALFFIAYSGVRNYLLAQPAFAASLKPAETAPSKR